MLDQPDLRPVKESGDMYRLFTEYKFTFLDREFCIPKGYQTDGASVPRWAYTLFGFLPDGVQRAAALVHDWLYEHKGELDGEYYTRREADKLFLHHMNLAGLISWKARGAYLVVRLLGRKEWKD